MTNPKQTNILKNFTDTMGFITAVFALIAVFLAKDAFEPSEGIEKFWQVETTKSYIMLAAVFFVSSFASLLTRKLPALSLPLSIVPMWLAFSLYDAELLPERPMIYILFGLVHFAGAVIHIGQWFADDRDYSKNVKRSYMSGFVWAVLLLALWLVPEFFLADKWQVMLAPLFYVTASLGAVLGIIGIAWHFVAPKDGRKNADLWNSLSASLLFVGIAAVRICLIKLGVF